MRVGEGRRRQPGKTAVAPYPRAGELLAVSITIPSHIGYVERSVNRTVVVWS